jgi:hypothetical protein
LADRGRLTANLAAVGVLVAVAAGVLIWQRPWVAPDAEQPGAVVAKIPGNSRALLAQTFRALTEADTRAEFVAAAGRSKAARTFAASVWAARSRLGVDQVGLVYEQGGDASDRADGSTSAQVKVTWTPSESSTFVGARPTASIVRFRLIPRSDGFDVVSAGAFGRVRLPIWLAGPVHVDRVRVGQGGTATTVMVGTARACNRVPTQAAAAVDAVRRVQPEVRSDLVVVCPGSATIAAALLGRSPSDVAQIAAVSTALGGSRGTPAIVLNPKLFGDMDVRARQVVMSHEATHVLTGVIGKKLDLWVAEGFADFVALRTDRASLSVSAGQILGRVRTSGAPEHLPTNADFAESAHGLGAVYESAWMVFRMLAEEFGEPSVTAFYREVLSGIPVADASSRQFGWSMDELTSAWRRYLTKSASTVS